MPRIAIFCLCLPQQFKAMQSAATHVRWLQRHESLVATTKLFSAERLKSPLNSRIGFSIFFCVCHLQFVKYFLLNIMTNTVTPQLKDEFSISAVCSKCKGVGTVWMHTIFPSLIYINATVEANSRLAKHILRIKVRKSNPVKCYIYIAYWWQSLKCSNSLARNIQDRKFKIENYFPYD